MLCGPVERYPKSENVHDAPLAVAEIQGRLSGKPKGTYLISPEDLGDGKVALRLSFVGESVEGAGSSIRSKILDIDPKMPPALEQEIQYLRLIHAL